MSSIFSSKLVRSFFVALAVFALAITALPSSAQGPKGSWHTLSLGIFFPDDLSNFDSNVQIGVDCTQCTTAQRDRVVTYMNSFVTKSNIAQVMADPKIAALLPAGKPGTNGTNGATVNSANVAEDGTVTFTRDDGIVITATGKLIDKPGAPGLPGKNGADAPIGLTMTVGAIAFGEGILILILFGVLFNMRNNLARVISHSGMPKDYKIPEPLKPTKQQPPFRMG